VTSPMMVAGHPTKGSSVVFHEFAPGCISETPLALAVGATIVPNMGPFPVVAKDSSERLRLPRTKRTTRRRSALALRRPLAARCATSQRDPSDTGTSFEQRRAAPERMHLRSPVRAIYTFTAEKALLY
jgi:hypothetical protein